MIDATHRFLAGEDRLRMTPKAIRDAANGPWEGGTKCPHCDGFGRVYALTFDRFGPVHVWDKCESCEGTGRILMPRRAQRKT